MSKYVEWQCPVCKARMVLVPTDGTLAAEHRCSVSMSQDGGMVPIDITVQVRVKRSKNVEMTNK